MRKLYNFLILLIVLAMSSNSSKVVHAETIESKYPEEINTSSATSDALLERKEYREEMQKIRSEHEALQTEHEKLSAYCADNKTNTECEKQFTELKNKQKNLHERRVALNKKVRERKLKDHSEQNQFKSPNDSNR